MKKSLITAAVSIAILGVTVNVQAESPRMTSTPVSVISIDNIKGTPNIEQMWQLLQQQQAEIKSLKQQLQQTSSRVEETEVKVEATADAVERGRSGSSSVGNWTDRTTIGGYGEMHYNNLDNKLNAPWASDDKAELDFHRFVMFIQHDFNERTRLFSEIEIEHSLSGDGKEGEVELEQAYIEYDITGTQQAKVGLFLMPVGILNETHEPDTFLWCRA